LLVCYRLHLARAKACQGANPTDAEADLMPRRLLIAIICLSLSSLAGVSVLHASNTPLNAPDYSRLLAFVQMQDLQDPLVAFGAAENDFDRELNRENIAFLSKDKALLDRILSQLKGDKLRWQLTSSFKRLLAVPENRDEYAQLFERYCRSAVDYLLGRIHMPDPYDRIITLKGPLPQLPVTPDPQGITVYLVHNLVDEYIEEYLFFSQNDNGSKIKIKLSNRVNDGKVGSVTSLVTINPDNQFEFSRVPYTIWQNSAQDPLNVLIVPIEETLHILMRPFTERAMKAELEQARPTRLDQVQQVVDDWMAVEEAVVGGVVWQVMPEVCARFVPQQDAGRLTHALTEREQHAQYRLLRHAIQVVENLGVNQTLTLYRDNPLDFKQMVSTHHAPPAMQSALRPRPADSGS
jgi:hypothetical protein